MAFILELKRVAGGILSGESIPDNAANEADVNSAITRSPDFIQVMIDSPTEAQIRGLCYYAKAIDNQLTTTSIETAIAAVFT